MVCSVRSSSIHLVRVVFFSRLSLFLGIRSKRFEILEACPSIRSGNPKHAPSCFLSTNWNKETCHKEKRDDDFVFSSGKRVKIGKDLLVFYYFCLVVLII